MAEKKSAFVIFEDYQIRKIHKRKQTWISALDVAKALEYSNPAATISNVIDRNRERFDKYLTIQNVYSGGQNREMIFFNLKGVIAFCMFSKQKKAVKFQRWADEVLEKEIKNIPTDIRLVAKRKRVEFTDTLKDHGYTKKNEYIKTTIDMKDNLGIDKMKKKSDSDLIEVMKIASAETLAKTKIMIEDANGFDEVNGLCIESSRVIKENTQKKIAQ